MKYYVNVPSKSKQQKNLEEKNLVGILKVTDKKSRIRSRIRTKMSRFRNTAVSSVSDPDSLNSDPDSGFLVNPDLDQKML